MSKDHTACFSGLIAAAMALGVILPASVAEGRSIVMPLCGGGGVAVPIDDTGMPPDERRGCHVACTLQRKTRDVDPHPDA